MLICGASSLFQEVGADKSGGDGVGLLDVVEHLRGDGIDWACDASGDVDGDAGSCGGEGRESKSRKDCRGVGCCVLLYRDTCQVKDGGIDIYLPHYVTVTACDRGIQHYHRHE